MFLKISYLTSASQILKTPGENLTATLITYFNFLSHFSKLSSTLLDRMTTHAFYFFISNFLRCTLHNLTSLLKCILGWSWRTLFMCSLFLEAHLMFILLKGRCHSLWLLKHFCSPTLPQLPVPLRIQDFRHFLLFDIIY